MTQVVSVRFRSRGKLYYFDPGDIQIQDNTSVIVETSKGLELGEAAAGNHFVPDGKIVPPLRPVVRVATADDLRVAQINKDREAEAMEICQRKIAEHGLDMKLVDVECNFEGNKIMFFFTSDGRVDFRELVKDLASVFRTRIELRQIGVRDEAKMLGGMGICGRQFCCSQFLDDFHPVSTKMAKVQSMSLNPTKISGSCGRLMCCLRYEQEAYEELVRNVPKNGAFVETPDGYGNVAQVSLLRQKVKVKIDGSEQTLRTFDSDEVAEVPGGRPKTGEPLPSVLKLKPKPEPESEPEEPLWEMPPLFLDDTGERPGQTPVQPAEGDQKKRGPHRKTKAKAQSQSASGQRQAQKSGVNGKGQQPQASQAKHRQQPAQPRPAEGGQKKGDGQKSRRRRYSKPRQPGNKPPESAKQ